MRAYPLRDYPAQCGQAAALMLMICNNLDPRVAQFPLHLVTYGGNGQAFSNWCQVHAGSQVSNSTPDSGAMEEVA